MADVRNIVNLKDVAKRYGSRDVLTEVTVGVNAGDRIGIVGGNGHGKSTLLRLVAGVEPVDEGRLTVSGWATLALLGQGDELDPTQTIRDQLIGDRAEHEWTGDSGFRNVLNGLLGGIEMARFADGPATVVGQLSGGERRRIALARVLFGDADLLLLDEPTNHLDIEGVDWLARHLAARRGSLMVVTHDRWFLDAVCNQTWEVSDQAIHQYEGGYAAYVLARAERERQQSAQNTRRNALIRKELAWLRRGPPARTTKPKFRVDAANQLIADEPPPRNTVELLRFATARLGNRVLDAINVSIGFGDRALLNKVTWRLGPADRVALVGVNGAGKTTLLKLLAGELQPDAGVVKRGQTVRLAHLSQDTAGASAEALGELNVLEALEEARLVGTLSDGVEISAAMLCDRFGFRGSRSRTLVRDLSGGERRRLQLMRLLMTEPNVLLLDEPTNDLDIDTLTALEDLLDDWPGTLIIVSHDRYFVERVCDNVHGLMGDGNLRHLARGIEQYVELRRLAEEDRGGDKTGSTKPSRQSAPDGPRDEPKAEATDGAKAHQARKAIRRAEQALAKLSIREDKLSAEMSEAATDHVRLAELQRESEELAARREQLEADWLINSELVER